MKVIDLLNIIANGEEVPKKVFYKTGGEYTGGYYWKYDESCRDYKDKAGDYVFNAGNYHVIDMLNMEVEIIEEDKKIEKINAKYTSQVGKLELANKIDEIIDYLNQKGKEL